MGHRHDRAAVTIAAFALLALGLAAALAASTPALASSAIPVPTEPARAAGDEGRLTTRQLVGQRVIWSYAGATPPAALRTRIARGEAAGVILFRSNVASRTALAATVRSLQAIRRPPGLRDPLLVMIDQEGGQVKRLSGAPLRSPAQLGRIGSVALTRSEGAATARNLRSVGVNVNLAPVLDVGRPGSFQQRSQRSYSSDPAKVARLGSAFVGGLQGGRVAATLKHFPGLGTVGGNQDDAVQRVRLPLGTLRAVDQAPFAAGIRAGARLVMTSSAVYSPFGPFPGAFSTALVQGELRARLGFGGVTITDDLDAAGLRPFASAAGAALRSARAGNDLLLFAGGYATTARSYEALVRDAAAGRISATANRAAVRRVLALRGSLR